MYFLKYVLPFLLLMSNVKGMEAPEPFDDPDECNNEIVMRINIFFGPNNGLGLHLHDYSILDFKNEGYTNDDIKSFLKDLIDSKKLYKPGDASLTDGDIEAINNFFDTNKIFFGWYRGGVYTFGFIPADGHGPCFDSCYLCLCHEEGKSFYSNEKKIISESDSRVGELPITKETTFNDLIDKLNNITSSDGFKFAPDTKFKFVVEYPDGDSIKLYKIKEEDLSKFICTWIYPIKIIVPDNCRFEKVSPAASDSDSDSDSDISEDKGKKTDDNRRIKDNKGNFKYTSINS